MSLRGGPRARRAASGLLARDRPVVAMLSGGRDSTCLLDVARRAARRRPRCSALHVNYGLRAQADADERHCARCARSSASSSSVARARGAEQRRASALAARRAARRRPRGAATCRRGRASCATRRRRASPSARRADRDRATPPATRSRRSSTGSPPRPGGARCWGCAASDGRLIRPLLRRHARADRRLLPRARARLARGREQRRRALRARARAPRAAAGAARRPPGGRGERAAHRRAAARGDRAARRARRRRAGGRAQHRARAPARAAGGARAAGRGAPRRGRGRHLRAAGRRAGRRRSSRSGAAAGARELHVGGRRGAVIDDGVLEMVKLPPRAGELPTVPRPRALLRVATPRGQASLAWARCSSAPRSSSAACAELGEEISRDYAGPAAAAGRRAEGRGVLPQRPHALHRHPRRGRLHGGRLLRLGDRLLRASCGSSRTSTRRSKAATC